MGPWSVLLSFVVVESMELYKKTCLDFILQITRIICVWSCLGHDFQVEEIHFVGFLSKLLETKIMQVLRFKHGQVSTMCYLYLPSAFLYGTLFLRFHLFAPDILCRCFGIPWR